VAGGCAHELAPEGLEDYFQCSEVGLRVVDEKNAGSDAVVRTVNRDYHVVRPILLTGQPIDAELVGSVPHIRMVYSFAR